MVIGIVNSVSYSVNNFKQNKNQCPFKKSNAFGSMYWKGLNPLEFKIEDVINNVSFKKGDTIITVVCLRISHMNALGEVVDFESDSQKDTIL